MSITCSVLLEIQATLKTPPSARESMMKGIYLANAASGWITLANLMVECP